MHFLLNWRKLTSDRLVWEIVEDYRIPLKCVLNQWQPRLTKGSSIEQTRLLKTAIHELQKKGSERSRRSVPVNTVHLETRREESTSVQPKITEPLCTAGEAQTGGSGQCSDTSPTWRLHDETRFTRCILHGAHTRATQEVPKTAISEQNIRIPVSPLRSFI